MKSMRNGCIWLCAGMGLLAQVSGWASAQRYDLVPAESRLSFTGSSPLHGFEGEAGRISGSLTGDWETGDLSEEALIHIPVFDLHTGNVARDHAVQATTKAAKNPEILFRVHSISKKTAADGAANHFQLHGDLEVGGVSKPVDLDVTAVKETDRFKVSGETQVTLSQFDLKPPAIARLMGLREEVRVSWDTVWQAEKN